MTYPEPTPTTVEIVDDHALFANTMSEVVRALPGYRVVGVANTGARAIEVAREQQPDVILLDFHLPGVGADELIPRIGAVSPGSQIVILTSDLSESTLVKGVQAGAIGFLTKNTVLDDLERALRTAARREIALTEEQLRKAGLLESAVDAASPAAAGAAVAPPDLPVLPVDAAGISIMLSPIPSFTKLAQLENALSRLPGVDALYVREFRAGVAVLTVHLGPQGSSEELARALAALLHRAGSVDYRIQGIV